MALTEGKGVKLHLPAPFHSCVTGNDGRAHMLGDVSLLGYKSSMAGPAQREPGERAEEIPRPGTEGVPYTPSSLHPRDEMLNDVVLFFLEITKTKRRGFS